MLSAEQTATIEAAWEKLFQEAQEIAVQEPCTRNVVTERILNRDSMSDSLAHVLAGQLNDPNLDLAIMQDLFKEVFVNDPKVVYQAVMDLEATLDRDPACTSMIEPLMFFKGFQSVQTYRVANHLWQDGRFFLAKMIQSACSRCYEVDIHPASKIGHGILLDHATNIVVGETAVIGNNVSILHGVTLGGTGKTSGDRHPKIGDGVMLGAHAQLLGNIKVGTGAKIGAGAVVLGDVPEHTTFAGVPAVMVGRPKSDMPALDMNQDFTHED